MAKKRSQRVSALLSSDLLQILDDEVIRLASLNPGSKLNRTDAFRAMILRHARDLPSGSSMAVYREHKREAGPLKLHGMSMKIQGEERKARRALLRAAALELEALAALDEPSESTMIGALIEILGLIKQGTDYKSLPDVPVGKWASKKVPQKLLDTMIRRD